MRPQVTNRRQPAIALVLAAWCAVYGIPSDLVRNLAVQTAGLAEIPDVKPAAKAKSLLTRFSVRIGHTGQSRFTPVKSAFALAPSAALIAATQWPISSSQNAPILPQIARTRFQRPPPLSFPV